MGPQELAVANAALARLTPGAIVEWAYGCFGNRLVLSTSFGRNSAILLHLAYAHIPECTVVHVNPGDVPETNRVFAEELGRRFGFAEVREFFPDEPLTTQDEVALAEGGAARQEVYDRRKVPVLRRALRELKANAVLYGARFDQKPGRESFTHIRKRADGVFAIYPILRMDKREAHAYIIEHDLPVHPEGMPEGGGDECGIHLD